MIITLFAFVPAQAKSIRAIGKVIVIGDDIILPNDGLNEADSFELQFEKKIAREYGGTVDVKTVAQEGATTVSAMALIPGVLAEKPEMVIVALGYNDALARNDPDVVYNNLENLLKELERGGAYIVLVGTEAPVWMDHAYTTRFNNIFPKISQRFRVMYHNGFLKGVQGDPLYTFEDRYHPNRLGVERIADNLLPSIGPLIKSLRRIRSCERNPRGYKCDEILKQLN